MGAISFSLDERLLRFFKAQLPLELFVETGTFRGDTLALARPFFQRCLSVELSSELHRQAQARFAGVEGVEVLCGPSPELLRARQAGHQAIPTLFWLDAHWCVAEHTSGEESQSPLLGELRALGGLHRDSVVLIDDARLYQCPPPQPHRFADWPEWHDLVRTLLELSPGHRLAVFDDVIAFYPAQLRETFTQHMHEHGADWLKLARLAAAQSKRQARWSWLRPGRRGKID